MGEKHHTLTLTLLGWEGDKTVRKEVSTQLFGLGLGVGCWVDDGGWVESFSQTIFGDFGISFIRFGGMRWRWRIDNLY